jgi:DNA-binding response OmpR family regulator
MLSARTAETSRVAGLEAGADDYVTKPFSGRELIARVRAHLRRLHLDAAPVSAERLEAGNVVLDAGSRRVMVREREVGLTPKEFELLFLLMKHPGRVLERNVLLDRVWGEDFRGDPQTLHVHIRWLREKIEAHPGRPQHIETVHGVGYRFRP